MASDGSITVVGCSTTGYKACVISWLMGFSSSQLFVCLVRRMRLDSGAKGSGFWPLGIRLVCLPKSSNVFQSVRIINSSFFLKDHGERRSPGIEPEWASS
jgi:hypothetical protein